MSYINLFAGFARYFNLIHGAFMPPNQLWYCKMLVTIIISTVQASALLLVGMTFERFYSIIRPHKAVSFNTVKRAKTIILCIVVFSYSFHSPYWYLSGNNGDICILNAIAAQNIYGKVYHWITQFVSFIFPFGSLLIMNSFIIHTLRQRSKLNFTAIGGENREQSDKNKHPEKQLYTMLLLVTFAYLILTLPVKILEIYLIFYSGQSVIYYAGQQLFYQVAGKAYYSNHGVNFFLYVMSGQKFRTDLKNLFIRKKRMGNESATSVMTSTVPVSSFIRDTGSVIIT